MQTIFKYRGRNTKGKLITGELTANTIEDVIANLKQNNITPIDIKSIKPQTKLPTLIDSILIFRKIAPYHIMNFCRELAVLHNAGLPLIKSINKLSLSASSHAFKLVLANVENDLSSGMTLAEALKKHPTIFSPLIVSVIDIGENTGHLSEVLVYLGNYIETSITNHRRLLSAIRYPTIILISITAASLLMNFIVIPKFTTVFSKYNIELPLATRILLNSSNFLTNNKLILTITALASIFTFQVLIKTPKIRYVWDKYKLKVPIFGDLQKRIILSQFTWTFSLILRAGVPIIKGLTLASNATENAYFSSKLLQMSNAIEHGENLSQAAIASGLFTPMTIQMIEVGEESEKLDDALIEIAKYYDAEIDYDLKRLNELVEPILLLALGIMVLVMTLGIYFPLWDLIRVAKT